MTGPEQENQEDGSDTENSLVAVGASRDAGARDSWRCICDSTASGQPTGAVRRRRGKQGNQNSGPRKKNQPDQRCSELEGTSACVSLCKGRRNGKGEMKGTKRERSRVGE